MKNSNDLLLLKHNHDIIDFVAWEGLWEMEANEGELLYRISNDITIDSWKTTFYTP